MESILQTVTTDIIKEIFPGASLQDLGTPDLTFVDWGVLDYFGWIHPAGHSGCVIAPINGELRGMQMRRMQSHSAKTRTHMCSWCHHVYRNRGTAMFSTRVVGSDGRRRIGNYICLNLDCSLRIRNLASDPPTYLPETIELSHKVWRLQTNITTFMARANLLADLL